MRKRKILWPIFSFIIFLSIILTIVSFLATKSTFVKQQVEQIFKNVFESNFNVKVEIGATEGNILTGYTFNDITLYTEDSLKIGTSQFISIEFNFFALLKRQKVIERILIKDPSFDFTKISPQMLIKKGEETVEEEKKNEEEKPQGIAFKNVSIIRAELALQHNNRIYTVKDLNMDGNIYLSSSKNRIILEKCNARFPPITDIKSISGIIIFKNDFISLLNCSLKTSNSLLFVNGNLFDESEGLSIDIKTLSLEEISKLFVREEKCIRGTLKGKLDLKGKRKNIEADGSFSVSNITYKEDSLGGIFCNLTLMKEHLDIKKILWKPPHGEVFINGHYNLIDKNFDFETKVHELVLDNIIKKFTGKNWNGKLTGEIIAEGSNIGDPVKREIEIKAHLAKSFIKNFDIDSLDADVSYNNKIINLRKMSLYLQGTSINVEGLWGKEKKFYVKSNNFYISPLLELFGINDVGGYLSMKGTYEEREGKRIVQAKIDYDEPCYKNMKGKNLRAIVNFNIQGENSHLVIKDIDFLNTHLDSLRISIISDTTIKSFSFLSQGKEIYLYSKVNITKENGNLFFMVDTLNLKFNNAEIKNKERLEIEIVKDGMRLKDGILFLTNNPIVIDLAMNKGLDYKIKMKGDSLDLRAISGLLKFDKDLGGTFGFEITGQGSLRNPRLRLNINSRNFFLEEMRADEISGTFEYFNDEIQIASLKILKGDEISEAKGIIPLTIFRKKKDRTRRIEFTITANDLGDWIFYPFNRYCHYEGGKVYGTIRGKGTVGKIDMKGDLRIYSTNVYIPFLGIRMKNTDGYLQLTKEAIEIKNIRGTVEDGYLDLKGRFNLHGIKPESIDLLISGEHIPITGFKDFYLTVNPQIELKGPFSKLLLLGSLDIEQGDITIPFRRKREEGIRSGDFSYDLKISADEGNIWLKNEDVDVELKGKIFAKGTGNVPQLSGSFETKRGFIYYLDHTFTIEKGVFRFTNSPEFNPEIELCAETKVHYKYSPNRGSRARDTTAIVYLNVGGTMQRPEFSLTSSNPSFTEENIILLLSLNITSLEDITSLANVSSLSDKAACYWIRQTLLREFQTTLGIDAIDLETKLFGAQKTAKLTVGKYISKDLYLGVTHDIFATSKDEFEIEYRVWKGSYIIGERKEDGRYNLGVKFKFKY